MANISTLTISGSNQYINITDHASAPSPTAGKLYANSTSIFWEDTDLAAGGGDAMDKVKSQGPTTEGTADGATGLANSSVFMAPNSNTAVNILFNQGTTITGSYNTTIHIGGDCQLPGVAITSDGTNGSQTFNDLALNDATITAQGGAHHDSGGSVSLRMAGAGYGDGTDAAYNALAMNFDGTGDFLQIPTGDYLGFDQTEDFTLDMFLYPTTLGSDDGIFTTNDNNSSLYGVVLHTRDTSKLEFRSYEGAVPLFSIRTAADLTTNLWQHVAVDRHNGVTRIYINGAPQTIDITGGGGLHSLTPDGKGLSGNYGDDATGVSSVGAVIGRYYINSHDNYYYVGYIDNFRYTKGYARFRGNDFSTQLPILGRKITGNRGGEFTVRGQAFYAGGGDDVSLADTGIVNRTGDDTTGEGLVSVVIDAPQTVNSTAFMVPVIFKNTSDVQLTLNYNMWASVRANTATDDATTTRMTHYGARGLWLGGQTAPALQDTIDYNTIATSAEAVDFGNLTTATRNLSAASGGSRAVVGGGTQSPGATDTIEFVTVASTGEATDFGNLAAACRDLTALADGNRGCFAGGDRPSTSNVIDFITISVAGNASDFGDMGVVRSHLGSCSNGSRGIVVSDYPPQSHTFDIEYFAIGTLGNTLDFGSTIEDKPLWGDMATDDGSRGVFMGGGTTPPNSDTIDYINMGSIGNSADFGNLNTGRGRAGACSDGTRGLLGGGYTDPGATYYDSKDLITIGTLGNASDFNELSQARNELASTSGD